MKLELIPSIDLCFWEFKLSLIFGSILYWLGQSRGSLRVFVHGAVILPSETMLGCRFRTSCLLIAK